ncbi:hypothetical protein OPV22_022014 [Ensete ventricosum]|uniref:Uncharacterized protein n=1 Tax=Ensete ventricosum TaxID=4639 RepID=A0AAV8QII7_ENSVE|nr:hypothetical protein OPV22_022014 [Ensete ventricosum]
MGDRCCKSATAVAEAVEVAIEEERKMAVENVTVAQRRDCVAGEAAIEEEEGSNGKQGQRLWQGRKRGGRR